MIYSCYEESDPHNKFGCADIDRIRRAEFQVAIEGTVQFGDFRLDLQDHWRMDTHGFAQGDANEPHPLFHFQRGGHAQDHFATLPGFLPGACLAGATFAPNLQLCSLMQTQTPRLAMPPMDPICVIDFVIGQHNGAVRSPLRKCRSIKCGAARTGTAVDPLL